MFNIAKRFEDFAGKSVWVEFSALCIKENAVNLGQGFPEALPWHSARESLHQVANSDNGLLHQYTRGFGHPKLVGTISKLYSELLQRSLDGNDHVLITGGAYPALYNAINGFINPGDEVLIIEPYFDCYDCMVRTCGGIPVFVPLRPSRFGSSISSDDMRLDMQELASAITSRTKMIILNTPNNPMGKVFSMGELQSIAALCCQHNLICVSDEVYEWIVYDDSPHKHIRIATLPEMWPRTITIGSIGKTLSITGWKLGWAIAPTALQKGMRAVHQNCVYTICTPIQEAAALSLEKEYMALRQDADKPADEKTSFIGTLASSLKSRRDKLSSALQDLGFKVIIPDGGYFLMADYSSLLTDNLKQELSSGADSSGAIEALDFKFSRWMIKNKKLAAIPPTAFYSKPHWNLGENFLRFCFCKNDETIDKGIAILQQWHKDIQNAKEN